MILGPFNGFFGITGERKWAQTQQHLVIRSEVSSQRQSQIKFTVALCNSGED